MNQVSLLFTNDFYRSFRQRCAVLYRWTWWLWCQAQTMSVHVWYVDMLPNTEWYVRDFTKRRFWHFTLKTHLLPTVNNFLIYLQAHVILHCWIPNFNDPKEERFWKYCGKRIKRRFTSIFPLPHNNFSPFKKRTIILTTSGCWFESTFSFDRYLFFVCLIVCLVKSNATSYLIVSISMQ